MDDQVATRPLTLRLITVSEPMAAPILGTERPQWAVPWAYTSDEDKWESFVLALLKLRDLMHLKED